MAIDEKKLKEVLDEINYEIYLKDPDYCPGYIPPNQKGELLAKKIDSIFTEEPEPKKPLKIEVGKHYLTRDGDIVYIYKETSHSSEIFRGKMFEYDSDVLKILNATWHINGKIDKHFSSRNDLIEEVE